ncbi:hypothetical protein AC579_2583 [Pseudocercospora musae]|uniref:Uncharacterized protein n=1 Tax=Pseudocercospora musae TaxID=113226 RepID=A0A139IEL3_9PEZI|nr:hypothetical protein AC579_2583 [Pseudocercospora musae]
MAPSQRGYWEPTQDKASRRNNAKIQRQQVATQPDDPRRRQRKPPSSARIGVNVPRNVRLSAPLEPYGVDPEYRREARARMCQLAPTLDAKVVDRTSGAVETRKQREPTSRTQRPRQIMASDLVTSLANMTDE